MTKCSWTCLNVEAVDEANELLIDEVHAVDVFDDVVARLIYLDEMMLEDVGVHDGCRDVSPLDARRPAGSISRWTRMYDVQCFPLMQH